MKGHIYEYDEVVVGGNLAAALYCYINHCPLIFKPFNAPHFYEYFKSDFSLEKIFLFNETSTLRGYEGPIKVGLKKRDLYDRTLFILSIAGLVPISDKVENIRLEDDQNLKVITDRSKIINIKFNTLRVFNPQIISGLNKQRKLKNRFLIHDNFNISCRKHEYDFLEVGDNFVNKLFFYESKSRKRKLLAVSKLLESELQEFDYSVIPLKYKIRHILTKFGVQKHKNYGEIGLDFLGREVYNHEQDVYEESESVFFDKRTEEEICSDKKIKNLNSDLLGAYPWKLNHLLLDSSGMIR